MMGKASIDFESEIEAEWLEMMGGLREAVVYIATEGLAKVTEKTPVDIGTLQNNWLVSVGNPDDSTTESLEGFAGKSAGAIASYASAEGFPIIYLQNNLEYALRIERGFVGDDSLGRTYSQAPLNILAMTVAELEMIWSGMESKL